MNVKHLSFAMMFLITFAYADNEIYIDQVGAGSDITIKQDGSGNKVGGSSIGGDTTKMVLNGLNMNFNAQMIGSSNSLIGSVYGTSTFDLDVAGSTNNIFFDVDKNNVYGAGGGDYLLTINGGNNDLDFDIGSIDGATNGDLDFVLDGDFNAADINIDVNSFVFNADVNSDNLNLLYNATGYDGHNFVLTGTGNYWDIDVHQTSTLQSDSLEIDFSGSGTSITDATICITQSDSGTATTCP